MAFMAAWTQNSFKVQTPATPFNSDHWVCVGVGGQGVVLMPRGHGIKYVAKVFYAQAGAIETFQREAYSYALLHLQAAVSGLPAGGPLMLGWAELPGGLSALLLEHAGGGTLQSHIKVGPCGLCGAGWAPTTSTSWCIEALVSGAFWRA